MQVRTLHTMENVSRFTRHAAHLASLRTLDTVLDLSDPLVAARPDLQALSGVAALGLAAVEIHQGLHAEKQGDRTGAMLHYAGATANVVGGTATLAHLANSAQALDSVGLAASGLGLVFDAAGDAHEGKLAPALLKGFGAAVLVTGTLAQLPGLQALGSAGTLVGLVMAQSEKTPEAQA